MNSACVFSVDDAYVMPFQVFFHSLEATGSIPSAVPIFILHTAALGKESIQTLEAFLARLGRKAAFLDAGNLIPSDLPIRHGDHVSPATFYRLFIAEILPADVEHAVYLDSDMLARRSISALFTEPVEGLVAAADHCSPAEGLRLWGPRGGDYFQAGVLVIPVSAWRQQGMARRFVEVMASHASCIRWWDQDILNITLRDRWQRLPVWFNAGQHVQRLMAHDVMEANARIIHFDGSDKPWKCISPSRFSSHWGEAYSDVFGQAFTLPATNAPGRFRRIRGVRARLGAYVRRWMR